MAWIEESVASAAAGAMITLLDTVLVQNSHWEIYDAAAAANCKVYRCHDDVVNCDFYLKVDDNYADYCICELWEGWDAGAHAGTGLNKKVFSATSTFDWIKTTGTWEISLHDFYFILINPAYCGYFCGRPSLYDESKNIVMIISDSSAHAGRNQLSEYANGTNGGWAFLFDEAGNQTNAAGGGGGAVTNPTNRSILDIAGGYRVWEDPIRNMTTSLVVGTLPGVCNLGAEANGLLNGDIVTVDGADWLAIFATSWSLVRKD